MQACLLQVTGSFNISAEPVLDPPTLDAALDARTVPFPAFVLRGLVDLSWRLHLQPTDPGWVDIGRYGPLMDTRRAHDELGWSPTHRADDALAETVEAMGAGTGGGSPVLRPRASGPARLLEVMKGVLPGVR